MIENKYILVSGNMSSGKTTLTNYIRKNLNFEVHFEPFESNPYLSKYYEDMEKWSFKSQIYFIAHHLEQHITISNFKSNVVKDCSIYESVEVFGKNMYLEGKMTEEDWKTYYFLYKQVVHSIRIPDLIIKLDCPIDVLMERIQLRDRTMERKISKDYVACLDKLYNEWIERINYTPIIRVNSNENSYFQKSAVIDEIIKKLDDKWL